MKKTDIQSIFGQNKILNHIYKVNNYLKGDTHTLITVEIALTNKCNSQCPKCSGWSPQKTNDSLTLEETKDYIKQVSELEAKAIIFTGGGEPTCHPYLIDVIKYAKKLGLDVGLISNGYFPDQKQFETVKHCDWIRISLDAGNLHMYKKVHGLNEENFYKIISNIKRLVKERNQKASKCTIGVGYLTGKETDSEKEMEDFLKLATRMRVDYAQFRPFHDDFTDVVDKIVKLKKKYPNTVSSIQKYKRLNDKEKRPYQQCIGKNFVTFIGPDANVYTCCHLMGKREYSLGCLRNKSLFEIWQKKETIKINFNDCVYFCRNDEINRFFQEINQTKTHVNFL